MVVVGNYNSQRASRRARGTTGLGGRADYIPQRASRGEGVAWGREAAGGGCRAPRRLRPLGAVGDRWRAGAEGVRGARKGPGPCVGGPGL